MTTLSPPARLAVLLGELRADCQSFDAAWPPALERAVADTPDGHLTVRVLHAGAAPDEIAQVALGLDPARHELIDRLGELSYADWRVELLGLAAVET